MIESLTIRQIALIDEVSIQFHQGLQVLSGETGAGKSIVVDAVNLVLGGRADRDLIRSGCEKASVEAVFDEPDNDDVRDFMDREGIEYDGRTVVIFREISLSGKNICRIGGMVQPVSRLKELSSMLLDLHGQSEHHFLTDPDTHLHFLDQTGDSRHKALLDRTGDDCRRFLNNHRAYARLVRQNEGREERMKGLEQGLKELRNAKLVPGEDKRLLEEKKRLQDAAAVSSGLHLANQCITAGENGCSALHEIREASSALKDTAAKMHGLNELSERCEALYYELEDIAYQLSLLIDKSEADPDRLEKLEKRLDLIRRMEKKYGMSSEEICDAEKKMQEEYDELDGLADRITQMAAEHRRLLSQYRQTARELTESRKQLAESFETRMMKELKDLGMENTLFKVCFKPNDTGKPLMPSESGDDRIEFMISPNPGEPLKPLARIASGGELSRLMLAIKSMEASHTGVRSMVFDEIDTGISGRTAQVVAEKMIAISRERQVICVTHLPQIAAAADFQYLVQKSLSNDRTNTSVIQLDTDGRISEVGRMISGADGVTGASTVYASRMLNAASELKESL